MFLRYGSAVFFLIIISLSLMARIPALFVERLWPDEALYAYIAQQFLNDPQTILRAVTLSGHLPFFPLIIAAGDGLSPGLVGFHMVTILINLAGLVLVFELGKRAFGLFSGLLAMLLLALNVVYYDHASLILIDGLLTVCYLLFALALLHIYASNKLKDSKVLGWTILAAILVIICKWYAVLFVLPVLGVYFIFGLNGFRFIDRLKALGFTGAAVCLPLVPFFIFLAFFLKSHGGPGVCFEQSALYYLLNFKILVGGLIVGGFFTAGILFLPGYPAGIRTLFYGMIAVPLCVMSLTAEKDIRYALPVVPLLAIVSALGIKKVTGLLVNDPYWRRVLKCFVLVAGLFLFIPFFGYKDASSLSTGYTGFLEAGDWVRKNVSAQDVIFSGSRRQMKYCSGIAFSEDGGRIFPVLMPRDQFHPVRTANGTAYLVVDRWEFFHQPSWLYPFDAGKRADIEKMGFVLVKQFRNAVWIFRYAPETRMERP